MVLPRVLTTFNVAGFSSARTPQWFPALARYGVAAGLGLGFFVTDMPIMRRDVFSRIPVLRDFYPAYSEED
ncbi:hypothetical protein BDF22DRAFT_743120 [Syncephalis plumigaleata]|nr:hypothetical protein BDF22DRAFT_743120 [Syncephalis plumigaleata]